MFAQQIPPQASYIASLHMPQDQNNMALYSLAVADPESRVRGFLSGLRAKRAENFYCPRPFFLNQTLICKPATRTVGCNTMTLTGSA